MRSADTESTDRITPAEEHPDHVPPAEQRGVGPKRALVGRPMAGYELPETLLSKRLALPIFASDPLSSVAYATESALAVLLAVSFSARGLVFPISIGISILLGIVIVSYQQTVRAYTTSGGAYIVAKENLGTLPGLLAAAALLVDYVLTVAVSVAAGIFALTSAVHSLAGATVGLALGSVVVITLVNLRGVRESGIVFALPTYGFVAAMFMMVGAGLVQCTVNGCPRATVPDPVATGTGTITLFVLLRAFASGSAALTGVEAISNGVNAFRHPQGQNAARTLGILAVIAISLFLGVSYLAVQMKAAPSETSSVVSELARSIFPSSGPVGFMFYVVQGLTLGILVLAANTSFQGFPRLLALLANDRFAPRQFRNLGDRLVFSNGIIVLATLACILLWAFKADVNSLIHLYVVGVFTAFTLSQAGMVRYWLRKRNDGWQRRAVVNGFGSLMTGVVTAVVIATKFSQGAWAVVVAVPCIIALLYANRHHYRRVARRLRAGASAVAAAPKPTNSVVLYAERLDEATRLAAWYAHLIADRDYHPIAIPDRRHPLNFENSWAGLVGGRPRLEVLPSEASRAEAVLEYVWGLPRGESSFVTVIIPEQFKHRSMVAALAQGTELSLKLRLLAEPGVAVADVTKTIDTGPQRALPSQVVCRVLVSDVHAASRRALAYASTLGVADTGALTFAFDGDDADRMRVDWLNAGLETPLEVIDAPYRDLGYPLMTYLRALTADPETAVLVIMPELYIPGPKRILHNQTALYIKRLLLFERRVILTSVPFQLP